MEDPTNVATPSTESPNLSTKIFLGVIVIAAALIVGVAAFLYAREGESEVIVVSPTPKVTPSISVEVTSSPTTADMSKTFSNEYLSITIPEGWTYSTTARGAINIIKDGYILYINPRAQQASGVEGGRFAEISMGAPSSDIVNLEPPSDPCGTSSTVAMQGTTYQRHDFYISNETKQEYCAAPSNGAQVWYFSYVTAADATYGYFNYWRTPRSDGSVGYVITMAYNSRDLNALPARDDQMLSSMLSQMSAMIKSLVIK